MIGVNQTYFHPTLCVDPHFIVTGNTNDIFCTDELQIIHVEELLHKHLKTQGFDAVFFLDLNRGLHCYDRESAYVFIHGSVAENNVATLSGQDSALEDMLSRMAPGPRGRRQHSTKVPVNEPEREPSYREPLNFRMPISRALEQAVIILENRSIRCALVLNNFTALMSVLEIEDPRGAIRRLNTLMQLNSNSLDNQSIVVYLFRDSEWLTSTDARKPDDAYRVSVSNLVGPRIITENARENRVIFLPAPNEAEVRNFLNWLRLKKSNPHPIEAEELEELSKAFTGACARKNWSLHQLYVAIQSYFSELTTDKEPLSMRNWTKVLNEDHYTPPMERLQKMVGLEDVKNQIRQWHARMARKHGMTNQILGPSNRFTAPKLVENNFGFSLNVQLRGGAGTGKTTVAKILAELYYELGMLPQGHFIERTASNLISSNIGETAELVSQNVYEAMGGVLFIDEAYALAKNDHGKEAIDQLVADMSRYEGQFAVILAGYSKDMENLFSTNEGLRSRFPTVYEFHDYTGTEMRRILEKEILSAEKGVTIGEELRSKLDVFCENWVNNREIRSWGNGREAVNLAQKMINRCTMRMSREASYQTLELRVEDVPKEMEEYLISSSENLEEAIKVVNDLIGLHNVKTFIQRLCNDARLNQKRKCPGNYIFYGPPGTGKTTVGKKMAEIMCLLGVLPSKRFRYCQAQDLMRTRLDRNGNIMTTSQILDEELENAWGGILFIDEAHQLEKTDEGRQFIFSMVPKIDDPVIRENVCVICAGYTREMNDFLKVDPGLQGRFPVSNRIRFENYTAKELRNILEEMAMESGDHPTPEYLDRSENAFAVFLKDPQPQFGNGRFIRDTYLPLSRAERQKRLVTLYKDEENVVLTEREAKLIDEEERRKLTGEDIPAEFKRMAGPIGKPVPPEPNADMMVEQLVGKDEVKRFVHRLRTMDKGDARVSTCHLAFSGNTGSGRHFTAKVMARIWKQIGCLETGDFTIANRGSLVAGYIGQTPEKTQTVIDEAQGGTLIVEYPSSMLPSGSDNRDFGPEALSVLAGAMHRTDLSVILIDSEEGMEKLFQSYSVFRSALAAHFVLDDPTPEDMFDIFQLRTRETLEWEPELENLLPDLFQNWVSDRGGNESSVRSWGNAMELSRFIDGIINNWEDQQGEEHEGRKVISKSMIPEYLQQYLISCREAEDTAMQKLDDMIGLSSVKASIHRIELGIRYASEDMVNPGNYCFLGNPGTGKTTVARLMGGVLRSIHALEKGHVIERTAQEMMRNCDQFEKTLKLAKDGVLFIDEAPQLLKTQAGIQVIDKLLTVLEDRTVRRRTCIILAGYPKEMEELIESDKGLVRRFGLKDSKLWFDDYSADELTEIMRVMSAKAKEYPEIGSPRPLVLTKEFVETSRKVFRCARMQPYFGNAGYVRNYLHDSLAELYHRVDQSDYPPTEQELSTLTDQDIPSEYLELIHDE